jgi:hypothetical protein
MDKSRQFAPVLICAILASCAAPPRELAAPTAESPPHVVSLEIARQLKGAQDALQTRNFAAGVAQAQALESTPNLTPYDVHVIDELLGYGFAQDGELPRAADYLQRGFDDGFLPVPQRPARLKSLAELNYKLKDYAKAVRFGTLALKEGMADEKADVLVSQSYYLQGDHRTAAAFTSEHVKAVISRHETPGESSLQVILSSCVKIADRNCEIHSLENLVKYYPAPRYENQLAELRKGKG